MFTFHIKKVIVFCHVCSLLLLKLKYDLNLVKYSEEKHML